VLRQALDQRSSIHIECCRHLEDIYQGGIYFSPLQVTDVGAVETSQLAQILLAQLPPEALSPDSIPELLELSGASGRLLHPGIGDLLH
jgi:hypothetical protein